jgi:hypothetical protein
MILSRGHTTIRRPHRSIDNLCGVRTQEQGYLGDFVDVAYGLLTYVRIWRGTVSSMKPRERITFELPRGDLQVCLMRATPSMLQPSVASVAEMLVAIAPAAIALQRIPLEP